MNFYRGVLFENLSRKFTFH